ncbi:MAG: response regulator [Desulfobacteraceae bacterium]|nr:response regulator [Desulfobacteraceae bacterium]
MSKILAIDDKKDHLISLSGLLTTLIPDCHVTTALTGSEGIKKAQTELPDTILLNIKMPDINGFEVCRRLKADERTKHIPIVMLTATKTDIESRVKGLGLGADVFLDKTIDESELAAQVKVMLRIKKAEDLLRKEKEVLEERVQEKMIALRDSVERYDLAVSATLDGIWDWNILTNEEYYSPRWYEILGYSNDDPELPHVYDSWVSRIHPDDYERVMNALKEHLEGGKIYNVDYRHRHRSGEYRWQNSRGQAIFNENGKPVRMTGCIRDITEQKKTEEEKKRLEAQLNQAQKMESIGFLARGIAHDFNIILGIILGYTELALGDVLKWSPASHYLKEVRKACLRARELVRQILALSRQSKQEMIQLKIDQIIKESIKLLRASISSTIEIHDNISSKSDTVNADPTQINQIMLNLCNNAAHAMRENGGVLEITLENMEFDEDAAKYQSDMSPGNYVRLTVSATGHGIDPNIVERIFDPHFTTKEAGEGTGMGLAMVHGIVKTHGGAISVDSEPGKGTTVHVYLPAVKNAVVPEMKTIGELPGGNERLLLVDDEKAIVDTVQLMLERLGYNVEVMTSSIEALEAFRARPQAFDLVITEQSMPNMTGLDLSKTLMQIRSDIPIILCSDFNEVISEEKAAVMGIKALAMKPLVISEIAVIIRGVLDGERVIHILDPERKPATSFY